MPDASLTSRLDAAAVDHPSVRLARAAHALAEAELRIEVSKQIPWARWIQVGWGYQPKTDNGVTTYRNQLRIGIALDLPILDWNQGGVAAGKARRYREAQRFREALAEVAGAADEATGRWTAARERVEHLRTEAVPIAEKSVAATSEAVAGGRLSQTDLLKARLQAMEIQEALLEATKACREAAIDAEAALGVPLPEVPPAPANP